MYLAGVRKTPEESRREDEAEERLNVRGTQPSLTEFEDIGKGHKS